MEIKYIDRRSKRTNDGNGFIIYHQDIDKILEEEKEKGFIVDKIIDTDNGAFYILVKK